MKIFSSFLNRLKRKSTQRFIPEIDALRFFAIIPVLLLHFGTAMLDENSLYNRETIDQTNTLRKLILNGGNGVILFFAISGFILALPFIGKKIEDLRFKSYFIRRLIRIEPPYIIAITLFLFVHIILNIKSISFLWERYFASFFYLHNIIYEQWSYILPVAWSLEIEVQFYLLMPIFLYLICLFGNQLWRYAIYICMFVFFILVDVLPGIMDLSDYMYAFIPGIAAADFYKSKLLKKNMIWDFVFMISLVIFFVYGVSGTLKGLLLFLIITSSLNLVLLRKLLSNNIVVIIGGMCYSLYLLHYPLYFLLTKIFTNKLNAFGNYEFDYVFQGLIIIPTSIALISIYYLLIEKPFMGLSKKTKNGSSFGQIISNIKIFKRNDP